MDHHFSIASRRDAFIRRVIFFVAIALCATAIVWPFPPVLGSRAVTGAMLASAGTITASPNPIMVCDGTGLGSTTLNWSSTGATKVEVHVGSPSGALLGSGLNGKVTTGKSVSNGTIFYL